MIYYEIDENNVIRVYNDEQDPPLVLEQPWWQNGELFKDYADAESWAKVFVDNLSGANVEDIPGMSRDAHPRKKPGLDEKQFEPLEDPTA